MGRFAVTLVKRSRSNGILSITSTKSAGGIPRWSVNISRRHGPDKETK